MSNRRTAQRGWCVCLTASMIVFTGLTAACGPDSATPAPQGLGPDADNATSVVRQRSNATVKIMPLGDSITASNTGFPSYRYYLWHLLLAKGYHVDFVGSRHGPPANPDFDMDHEGHAGWKADEILARIQVWAMEASPDIVLLHIGHNDLCRGQSITSTVSDIAGIIDVLRMVNPHVRVLLAQVIASASTCHAGIPALNASLPALVANKDRPESPLTLVDQFSGFDPSTMTYDGTHPNAVGDERMADRWFEKLTPVLDTLLTEAAPEESLGRRE